MLSCGFPMPEPSDTLGPKQHPGKHRPCTCRNTSNQQATNTIKTQTREFKGKRKHPALQQKHGLGKRTARHREGRGASPRALGEQKGNPGAHSQRWLPRHTDAPHPAAEGCG